MKHLIFLFTISLLSCQNKKSENRERFNKPTINQTEKKDLEGKSDTIHINISKDIILLWNKNQNSLIKNQDYNDILKNKDKTSLVVEFVKKNNDLGISLCSKTTANLKDGDIAFIYLYENQKIPAFKCFKIQFDFIQNNCKVPEGLMDYVEKNRNNVSEDIQSCLNNG